MIIKGSSRGGATQLGPYLLNTKENTRATLIELVSPIDDLTHSLEDWQTLAAGTKQGKKGLYHAQIAPEGRYKMTPEQWQRCVDVLEEELGYTGQPRAVVLHEKNGKEHLHVVWQRTDLATMKFISDSYNFEAHERASQRLEKEFGHEPVPGKHAKREKKPVAEEARAREAALRETVARLYAQSDTAQAFRAALQEEGYILAKGDRRPHIIVDDAGKEHSLPRLLPDEPPKEIREFMAAIDRKTLPSAEEAKQMQREAAERPAEAETEKQPDKQSEKEADKQTETPKPEPPKPDPHAEAKAKLESDLKARHAEETRRILQQQQAETDRLTQTLTRTAAEVLFDFDALQRAELEAYDRAHTPQRGRFGTFVHTVWAWFNTEKAEEEINQRESERGVYLRNQEKERDRKIHALNQTHQEEARDLADRHAGEKQNHNATFAKEFLRYTREYEEAARFRAEMEGRKRQEDFTRQQEDKPPDSSL